MLLSFVCENLFCFGEETELMTSATADSRHRSHVGPKSRKGGVNPLRLIGIYGPNGHGKTKLVEGLRILQEVALGMPKSSLADIRPFRLDKSKRKKPSKLQIIFSVDNVEYDYGIIATNERIHSEWLYENEHGNDALLFSREWNSENDPEAEYAFRFGTKLTTAQSPNKKVPMANFLEVVTASVEDDESFLSECINHNIERLNPAISWLMTRLLVVGADSRYAQLHEKLSTDEKFLDHLNQMICGSDTGIAKLAIKKSQIDLNVLEAIIPSGSGEILDSVDKLGENESVTIGSMDGPSMVVKRLDDDTFELSRLISVHNSPDGEVDFDVYEESSGTQRLLDLYPMLKIAKDGAVTFVVDELDRKLHPLLSYDLIEKFSQIQSGQLIFTTHTTHLLDLAILRRDEIWLMQKGQSGSSKLYSLSDFKVRPDLDIRKGYLQGRFGAIPFLGSAQDLGWIDAAQ